MKDVFASRFREARKKEKLTQDQIADVCVNRDGKEMSRSSVCQWEKEGGTRPTFENLVAAAKLMRTSIDYLTGLRDNENTHEVNEKGAHYRNDSIPDSIRELLDAMIALPPAARHDINESIKNLTKLIRRIEEKK